jgi:hypothetical protein
LIYALQAVNDLPTVNRRAAAKSVFVPRVIAALDELKKALLHQAFMGQL